MHVREAAENDISTIVEIENRMMSMPWSFCSFHEASVSRNTKFYIAQENDKIAGYAVFYLMPPEAELPDIVVDDCFLRQGVASLIMDKAIEDFKAAGISDVFLEVRENNEPAKALYAKYGFEEIGIRKNFYSNPVENAICMRLTI